jgi:hypothetical protein
MTNENNQIQAWEVFFGFQTTRKFSMFASANIFPRTVERFSENCVWIDGGREKKKTEERQICETFEEAKRVALRTLESQKSRLERALESANKSIKETESLTERGILAEIVREEAERQARWKAEQEEEELESLCDEIASAMGF